MEPPTTNIDSGGAGEGQAQEALQTPGDPISPGVGDTRSSEPADESAVPDPTAGAEQVVSPEAYPLEMGLGAPSRPRRAERQEPSWSTPEEVEEIDRQPPCSRDTPPRPLCTFICRGDVLEVIEEEEASEQVKELKTALSSVTGRIEVSQVMLSIAAVEFSPQLTLLQDLLRVSEYRARLLEKTAPALEENKRLRE